MSNGLSKKKRKTKKHKKKSAVDDSKSDSSHNSDELERFVATDRPSDAKSAQFRSVSGQSKEKAVASHLVAAFQESSIGITSCNRYFYIII